MTIEELFELYQCLNKILLDLNADYLISETAALEFYQKILLGKAKRKDLLIAEIKNMLSYMRQQNLPTPKRSLLVRFTRIYFS